MLNEYLITKQTGADGRLCKAVSTRSILIAHELVRYPRWSPTFR